MLEITKLSNGKWLVHSDTFELHHTGPMAHVTKIFEELETKQAELDLALDELMIHNHNKASFGLFGRFMFTSNDAQEQKKAA